jgi:hypothetical protein
MREKNRMPEPRQSDGVICVARIALRTLIVLLSLPALAWDTTIRRGKTWFALLLAVTASAIPAFGQAKQVQFVQFRSSRKNISGSSAYLGRPHVL